jgi:hypothetical protein
MKSIRIHDMRHTFASHYAMHGGDMYVLKELLGHQDLKTTMRYAHLAPYHVAKTVNILDYGFHTPSQKPSLKILLGNEEIKEVTVPNFDPKDEKGSQTFVREVS